MNKNQTSNSSLDLIQKLLNSCFTSLTAIFPAWRQAVSGDVDDWVREYKRQLLSAFVERNINTQERINLGLSKARWSGKPWLPSVGEFCDWCKTTADDLGFVGPKAAFEEARIELGKPQQWRKWSSEIVYLAAVKTGFYDLKSIRDGGPEYNRVKDKFIAAYNEYVFRAAQGEVFALPVDQRLDQKVVDTRQPKHRKAGIQALSNMKSMFDE